MEHLVFRGVLDATPTDEQVRLIRAITPHVQERMNLLDEARRDGRVPAGRRRADFAVDGRRGAALAETAPATLAGGVRGARRSRQSGTPRPSRRQLRAALVDGLGLKPKVAFTPVRVAVTGRRVSPPLFESIEMLGRVARRCARIQALTARLGG